MRNKKKYLIMVISLCFVNIITNTYFIFMLYANFYSVAIIGGSEGPITISMSNTMNIDNYITIVSSVVIIILCFVVIMKSNKDKDKQIIV